MPSAARPARNAADTRRRLQDAAVRVFREKGFVATTVDELCAAAGVSKGAFFHHFADKQALAIAGAERFSELADGLFGAAPYRDIADPRDRLLAYIAFRKMLLVGDLPDVTCYFGTLVQETFGTHPTIRAACDAGIRAHADDVARDIAAARALYAPDADWSPQSLALHTQAVLQGAFILAKAAGDTAVAVESLTHLERYLKLLLPHPGPQEERP